MNKEDRNNLISIISIALPIMLLLKNNGRINLNLSFEGDLETKRDLIKNIKPYFSYQEQSTLSKVQDIIDILDKVGKVTRPTYDKDRVNSAENIPSYEKKERILYELSKYLNGNNKKIVDGLLETNKKVKETKNNLTQYQEMARIQDNDDKINSVLRIAKCLEPIMHDNGRKRMKKVEELVKVMKKPEDYY